MLTKQFASPIWLLALMLTLANCPAPTFAQTSRDQPKGRPAGAATAAARSKFSLYWPPALNNYYPDIQMMSLSGKPVRLSSFAGKVILVEPIGMSCPACQAYAGGDRLGGINRVSPQGGVESADKMLASHNISPSDSRLVRVQLLLYGPNMQAPTLAEAQAWAKHFGFGQKPNEVVLIADGQYQNSGSYNMIPGFQLIDKDFVLRSDACGHYPKSGLYDHLLPMLKKML